MEYYLFVILKFIIGFSIVITHMNISGKTQLSQMTPIDFIGNFVLGGVIGGVIYTDSIPLYQYVILLIIGVCFISLLNYFSKKFNFFRSVTIGNPIPIIKNGNFMMDNFLKKENKIDIINITSRLRSQGIHSYQEIYYAQIEPDGQLTVVCDKSKMPSVVIMSNGSMRHSELEQIEKDEDWLKQEMKKQNIDNADDIFLAEYWNDQVNFVMKDGKIARTVKVANL
nr:YetF domain-containing protein [uncultured Moellerella sp.]